MVKIKTYTSKEFAKLADFKLYFGVHSTKFGNCVLASTDTTIYYLSFVRKDTSLTEDYARDIILNHWPNVTLEQNQTLTNKFLEDVITNYGDWDNLSIALMGSEFQLDVWKALLTIKMGETCTYGDIAKKIGRENAVRAVGSAVGSNPVSIVVPCHRVVSKTGDKFKYGGGPDAKKALLRFENCNITGLN